MPDRPRPRTRLYVVDGVFHLDVIPQPDGTTVAGRLFVPAIDEDLATIRKTGPNGFVKPSDTTWLSRRLFGSIERIRHVERLTLLALILKPNQHVIADDDPRTTVTEYVFHPSRLCRFFHREWAWVTSVQAGIEDGSAYTR